MFLVTLATFRTAARQRADLVTDQHVSDPEANQYINDSCGELYDLFVSADANYNLKTQTFSTVGGQDLYPLAADFYDIKGVDAQVDSIRKVPVRPEASFRDRNRFGFILIPYGVTPWGVAFEYRIETQGIVGDYLRLVPISNISVIPLTVWYYPAPPQMVADSDSFNVNIAPWMDYVTVSVAIKMKEKQESDVTVLLGQLAELKRRIMVRAKRRDITEPKKMTSIFRGRGNPYGRGGGIN